MKQNWHNLPWPEIIEKFDSDAEQGLSNEKAGFIQRKFGKNLLPEEKSLSKARIFFEQIKSPLIYILLIAGVTTLFFKQYTDSIVIFGAVFLNIIVGYFQENKASEALKKLKKIIKIKTRVIRDGNEIQVDSMMLVPGDIIILAPGDKVPADGRIIKSYNLKINEMVLTGEWLSTEKNSDVLLKQVPLADRDNMVYMGTVIEDGKGKVIVTETGVNSEIGKISEMVKDVKEEKTPLQKKLAHLSKIIGIIITLIVVFIFVGGIANGREFIEMFKISIAIAVAAIPEGLPVAMTVILALGMERILKNKGLVRKLLAAETLGSTSIICTDKTLTLTEGKMAVSETFTFKNKISAHDGDEWKNLFKKKADKDQILLMTIADFCNEAFIENPQDLSPLWRIKGNPTDRALLFAGLQVGIKKPELEKEFPKIDEIPFNPQNKFIAALHKINESTNILCVSGAPEKILEMSSQVEINGKQKDLEKKDKEKIIKELEKLTGKGLRVVATGYRRLKNKNQKSKIQDKIDDLIFIGFIGLRDPLRKEVKEAIAVCKKAGIKPVLVTGDHLLTARAVASEINLKIEKENIIEGKELDELSDQEFQKRLKNIEVYARVEPRHKLRIVRAWQEKGEVVAMTGDGINDAPALKQADIGMALGSGTDVAKEVSDIVLLTDNFNIIVAAIEEGRAILDNIRKVITYLLASSFAEVILIGSSLFFNWPMPILAVQILWINLIEDGPLSLSLAFEPKEKDIMKRKPEEREVPLFTKEMKIIIFVVGIILNILLVSLYWALQKFTNYDIEHIRTIIFVGLIIDSIFFIFSCKNLRRNIWQINLLSNKVLIFFWILSIIMVIAAVYLTPFQILLKTYPLNLFDWILLLGLGVISLGSIEITKWYFITKSSLKALKK